MGATPQIIIQFAQCLDQYDSIAGGAAGAARAFFISQVFKQLGAARQNIANLNPALAPVIPMVPVVNSVCSGKSERLGITLIDNSGGTNVPPQAPTQLDVDQLAALNVLPSLPGQEQFAIQITPTGLQEIVASAWKLLAVDNGRVDANTQPDPNGNIELDKFQLTMANNAVTLLITGIYHDRNYSVPYTVQNIDTYSLRQFGVGSNIQNIISVNSVPKVNADIHKIRELEDAGIFIEALLFGILSFAPIVETKAYIDGQIAAGLAGVDFNVSLGSLFLPVFIPEILIPDTDDKIVFNYASVTVDAVNGILAFGNQKPFEKQRLQSVVISGPPLVLQEHFAPGEHDAVATYTAITQDIDPDSSNVVWSGDAALVQDGINPLQVTATFNTQEVSGARRINKAIKVAISDNSGVSPFKAVLEVSVGIATATTPGKPIILQPKRPFPFQE